jgi:ribosome assembly protein YihI (activator of Der GTPase)
MFFLLSFRLCPQQNQSGSGQNSFCPEARGGKTGLAQIMYTHVSKSKNENRKLKIKQKKTGWWSGSRYRTWVQKQKQNKTKKQGKNMRMDFRDFK